ncbi:MAG TPA: peptide chain release factor N(5)-glutamine methyltransferase [Burkholderiales bacterium]
MTPRSALAYAARHIERMDARALLTSLLQRDAAYLVAHGDAELSCGQALTYQQWVERRARGEPVAYIVGFREFYGRSFRVTVDVLIPRPETELLVDMALKVAGGRALPTVLDLGTGCGCIALSIAAECPGARVTAVDYSEAALEVARANASALGIGGVSFRHGDWYERLSDQSYDLIVSNPPYIAGMDRHLATGDLRFEPRVALTPGGDGMDALRTIIAGAPAHLVGGGSLWLEHGHDQAARCRHLFAAAGFEDIASHRDLAGIERVTGGRRA